MAFKFAQLVSAQIFVGNSQTADNSAFEQTTSSEESSSHADVFFGANTASQLLHQKRLSALQQNIERYNKQKEKEQHEEARRKSLTAF